jgi:hypothetical protein
MKTINGNEFYLSEFKNILYDFFESKLLECFGFDYYDNIEIPFTDNDLNQIFKLISNNNYVLVDDRFNNDMFSDFNTPKSKKELKERYLIHSSYTPLELVDIDDIKHSDWFDQLLRYSDFSSIVFQTIILENVNILSYDWSVQAFAGETFDSSKVLEETQRFVSSSFDQISGLELVNAIKLIGFNEYGELDVERITSAI